MANATATDTAPITRAEVMNLIQSQPTGQQDQAKKGNCHTCGKPGHWANKCPDKRKNFADRGTQNRGNRAHEKPKSWRTTPPPPGTGTAKKVKDKTFNWCEKCRRWTTTHTTATHTGQRRTPGNTNGTSPPQANVSTLSPGPSVWMFDFPPLNEDEQGLLSDIKNLFFAFLSSRIVLLFFASIILTIATDLAMNWIEAFPWSTILAWIANVLRDLEQRYPTVLFAPILWLFILMLPLLRNLPNWNTDSANGGSNALF